MTDKYLHEIEIELSIFSLVLMAIPTDKIVAAVFGIGNSRLYVDVDLRYGLTVRTFNVSNLPV